MNGIQVGTPVNGYCEGIFGRDSYYDRRVEAVGYDWVVLRTDNGRAEFVSGEDLEHLRSLIEFGHNVELDEEVEGGKY